MSSLYAVLLGSVCLFVYPGALWLYNHHADALRWLLVCAIMMLLASLIWTIINLVIATSHTLLWSSGFLIGSIAIFLMIAVLVGAETGKGNLGNP